MLIKSGLTYNDSTYDYAISAHHDAHLTLRLSQTWAVTGGGAAFPI